MSRRKLEQHLRAHGCELHHHGRRHDVWWRPPVEETAAVPRHRVVRNGTVRSICTVLGVPLPAEL